MAEKKGKPLVGRWKEDKNPVGIVKDAKKGKKVPVQVVKTDPFKKK